MIETTVNINIELRELLVLSAKHSGVSKQTLVHKLFSKVLGEARLSKPTIFKVVSYQNADPNKRWKHEPITLQDDMYEKCHDARRVLKLSVSLLLAYAIRTYLSQVIHELTVNQTERAEVTDNCFPQYSMQCIFTTISEGFIIRWTNAQKKNE